ncbi:MAG: quinoprotein relay system zinc metallohydrolase 1 [Hyphomicrobium sp.]|nr:quinoprotein relay system zinc metallohydrolase 1 [Hyphomicrobium sp.]
MAAEPRGIEDVSVLTRREVLTLAAAASATAVTGRSAAAPLSYTLAPEKLDDGIWLVRGAQEAITRQNGGAIANIAILDTEAGAVVIDTGPSRLFGEALLRVATELTRKPVVRVYNTHFHPDHVFGNQAFDAAAIAAPAGVIDGLKTFGPGFSDSMYYIAGDWMRGTDLILPGKVLDGHTVEDFGSRRLRALPMKGHTSSDLVLFDETSGFLFAGDLVFLDRAPTTPHADLERWRMSLANLGGIPHRRLVPGHGPAEDSARGIEETRRWIEMAESLVREAFEKGLDIAEATALPLPEWTKGIALARYEFERTIMHLYPKLEAQKWPRVDRS